MREIIDLTGKHFGDLTVLSIGPRNKSNKIQWYCKCICGKEILVLGSTLRGGKTNCGCKRKTTVKDLSNQRFGRLLVFERAGSDNNKKALWKCKCDCGNETIVRSSDLISNKIKSCGCLKTELLQSHLEGKKFGKLTVLFATEERIHNNIAWQCQCECGKQVLVSTNYLTTGNKQSCGCLVSKGENQIEDFLLKHDFYFQKQYTFKELVGKNNVPLRFDFCIFKDNTKILIEYQGYQHYYNIYHLNEEDWNYSLERDKMKKDFCFKNNLTLIEIKYNEDILKKLEELLC